jgi:hypothetical protein
MKAGDTYAESVKSVNTSYHQDKADEAEYAEYVWSTNLYKCTPTRRDQDSDIILFKRTFHATTIKAPK